MSPHALDRQLHIPSAPYASLSGKSQHMYLGAALFHPGLSHRHSTVSSPWAELAAVNILKGNIVPYTQSPVDCVFKGFSGGNFYHGPHVWKLSLEPNPCGKQNLTINVCPVSTWINPSHIRLIILELTIHKEPCHFFAPLPSHPMILSWERRKVE